MKSGAPWKLRGRRPEAGEIARPASRRSRRSVSEWLNSVIEAADDEDVERSPPRDSDREPPKRWRQGFRYESRHKERAAEANRRSRDREEDDEASLPRRGGPYREEQPRAGDDRPRRDRDRDPEHAAARPPPRDPEASIDQAVAEIMARQRALNGQASGDSVPIALPQSPAPAAPIERKRLRGA